MDCEKHFWSAENDPPEVAELRLTGCPLCILQEARDDAIELADSGLPGCSWDAAEAAHNVYASALERHREKLSEEEQKALDRQTVKDWLAWTNFLGG